MSACRVGHRGAAGVAPENSLAGVRAAAESGCGWVEVDVRAGADGALLLHHDAEVAGGRSVAALDRAAAGTAGLATLHQALTSARHLGLGINLELKTDGGAPTLAVAVGEALMNAGTAPDAVVLSSFAAEALAHAPPPWPRALLHRGPLNARTCPGAAALGATAVHLDRAHATAGAVAAIRRAGLWAGVYTVNDAREAAAHARHGASRLFTDVPSRLAGVAR